MPYGLDGSYRPHNLPPDYNLLEDPRAAPAQEVLDSQLGLSEEWLSIHKQKAHLPEEDFVIMEHTARSYSICAACDVPSYRKWLLDDNHKQIKDNYAFHKEFLKHLQWQRSGKRWLLKMPFHLFALDELCKTYPNARVIFMHRDPKETIGSWCSLVRTAREKLVENVDTNRIGREELENMSLMMNSALEFRLENPDQEWRFLDLQYEDLIKNPLKIVEQLYAHFEMEYKAEAKSNMLRYLLENRKDRDKILKHSYSLADFGLTEKELEAAFARYYEMGYLKYHTT
eukprot:GHVU01123211.1.p1 GENE.GHVU01123211.1~~GHVU01123211.1.p1  ORF type:complete len:295 (-),score=32.96 GHVU01123211.1:169-1023(-)